MLGWGEAKEKGHLFGEAMLSSAPGGVWQKVKKSQDRKTREQVEGFDPFGRRWD